MDAKDIKRDPLTGSLIFPAVSLGKNVRVEMCCLIGVPLDGREAETLIGDGCLIRNGSIIYAGARLGEGVQIEEGVMLSPGNVIGRNSRIGPKSVLRWRNLIGENVRVHSHAFVERAEIGDNVFIGPHVVFTDDRHPACPRCQDCTPMTVVEPFVSIGANTVIVPGVTIGHHTQIYAGSVITKDVEPYSVMAGNPARKVKDFRELQCPKGFYERPFEWWDKHGG